MEPQQQTGVGSSQGESEAAAQVASTSGQEHEQGEKRECPICKMMREGGCEKEFHAFMDCGSEAEKGQREYQECIQMFNSMKECMERNPAVFSAMLGTMDETQGQGQGQQGAQESTQQEQSGSKAAAGKS
eukprot:CAMPEP_0202868958 /NCGR_PEP_ID=MMETSP1391-20130828/11470_1 /ASSEMBLY_ACC=CAM_ASM_000867 /TAXON_ID=1034604 /ORGANISM="Chlamydomonas leiostraca, Strain SAG 11-49" /LENGTH=129 /DNA_ID=CAMNT_0049549191 /DNA_START=20 /DNA_END=409 /DNA_ORIENTATION=+